MTAFNHSHFAKACRTQFALDFEGYITVDLFSGGGGASIAIEQATGKPVDIAINHDAEAISLHMRNHPQAEHHQKDIREVCPKVATRGRPVGHLHGSPECTHHSQAAGGQPRSVESRSLSWTMIRWAGQAKPVMITMENVMQILKWGPLIAKRCKVTGRVLRKDGSVAAPGERVPVQEQYLIPDPQRKGKTWARFIGELQGMGYEVLSGKLNAAEYGAPTTRERLFLIARRDGEALHWPEPTHSKAPGKHSKAWVPVADCIDWSIPCPSIFLDKEGGKAFKVKRPLVAKTMARIRKGVERFFINHPDPFIVSVNHGGAEFRGQRTESPIATITTGQGFAVAQPKLAPFITEHANASNQRNVAVDSPIPTLCAEVKGGHFAVVAPKLVQAEATVAYMAQHNGGFNTTPGHHLTRPASAITTTGSQQNIVAASLVTLRNNCVGEDLRDQAPAITAGGTHLALMECTLAPEHEAGALRVAAFLMGYYGSDNTYDARDPAATITTRDRLALVTVVIKGAPYVIVDIGMRMLTPRELYLAQGFPSNYVIDQGHDGKPITARAQVRMCGNSVSPPPLEALLRANPLRRTQALQEAA